MDLERSSGYVVLIPAVGFFARILAPELYRMAGERDKPLLMWGFVASVGGALLLIFGASSAWLAIIYLSLIYTAVSVMNGVFLSFFPMRFAREGYVASVSGIMDFATYLGTGISSVVFGILIEGYGYGAMFVTWAVLCCFGMLLLKRK